MNPSAHRAEKESDWSPTAEYNRLHSNFGQDCALQMCELLPHATIVGIDEVTGINNDLSAHPWSDRAAAGVTLNALEQPVPRLAVCVPG